MPNSQLNVLHHFRNEGDADAVNMFMSSSTSLMTVPRRYFCCGSLFPVFGVRVSVTFHLTCMCVHIIFSSVWVAEWPSFWKKLLTRLVMFSLYFDYL